MQLDFVGRHFQPEDGLRATATEKLQRLERFLEQPLEAKVVFEKEKHREIVEAHLVHRHGVLQARGETNSMRESLDAVVDSLVEQAKRARKRYQDRRRRAARVATADAHWPLDVVEKGSTREGAPPRIIRSSLLRIKPMTIDDASLELEAADLGFVVFREAVSQRIQVLFKRRDGNYGLIAPEF